MPRRADVSGADEGKGGEKPAFRPEPEWQTKRRANFGKDVDKKQVLPYLVFCNDANAELPRSARRRRDVDKPHVGSALVRVAAWELVPFVPQGARQEAQSELFMELLARPASTEAVARGDTPPLLSDLLFRKPHGSTPTVRRRPMHRDDWSESAAKDLPGLLQLRGYGDSIGSRRDDEVVWHVGSYLRESRFMTEYAGLVFHYALNGDTRILVAIEAREEHREPVDTKRDKWEPGDPPAAMDSIVIVPVFLLREETLDNAANFFLRGRSYITERGNTEASYRTYAAAHATAFHERLDGLEASAAASFDSAMALEIAADAAKGIGESQVFAQVMDSLANRTIGEPNTDGVGYWPFFEDYGRTAVATEHRNRGAFHPLEFYFLRHNHDGARQWDKNQVDDRRRRWKRLLADVRDRPDVAAFITQMETTTGEVALAECTSGMYAAFVLFDDGRSAVSRLLLVADHFGMMRAAGGDYADEQRREDERGLAFAVRYGTGFTHRMLRGGAAVVQPEEGGAHQVRRSGEGGEGGAEGGAASGTEVFRHYMPGNTFVASPQQQTLRKLFVEKFNDTRVFGTGGAASGADESKGGDDGGGGGGGASGEGRAAAAAGATPKRGKKKSAADSKEEEAPRPLRFVLKRDKLSGRLRWELE